MGTLTFCGGMTYPYNKNLWGLSDFARKKLWGLKILTIFAP
jgi:hypothetical protein